MTWKPVSSRGIKWRVFQHKLSDSTPRNVRNSSDLTNHQSASLPDHAAADPKHEAVTRTKSDYLNIFQHYEESERVTKKDCGRVSSLWTINSDVKLKAKLEMNNNGQISEILAGHWAELLWFDSTHMLHHSERALSSHSQELLTRILAQLQSEMKSPETETRTFKLWFVLFVLGVGNCCNSSPNSEWCYRGAGAETGGQTKLWDSDGSPYHNLVKFICKRCK